ncbi:hypothetical protein D7Y53_21550 [Stenotrophomonas maltophilia]|nr:hypothetical protein [Stenotrophomonas maltophilia]MBA0539920.1 hypothetical protein [Stenotrophomonas maltophilia]
MICSSEKRFFTSNLLVIEDWTPNRFATQSRGDVARLACQERSRAPELLRGRRGGRAIPKSAFVVLTVSDPYGSDSYGYY